MNSELAQPANEPSPLPARQLQWFSAFFHLVFFVGVAVSLVLHWRRPESGFRFVDLLLLCLVLIQCALYSFLFLIPGHTTRWLNVWWLLTYFAGSLPIFFIECRIDSAFYWLVGLYLAHILALPWRAALPMTLGFFAGFFLILLGWQQMARFSPLEWFIAIGSATACTGLLLFLQRAITTSTERAMLIQELEAAKRNLEVARQRDAELATLQERERLARELHDSLGHSLVTMTVQLEAAQRLLASDPARAGLLLSEMQKLTRSSMEELRRSLANLRASGLGDRSLADALQTLCTEGGQRSDSQFECRVAGVTDRLPPLVVEAFWRIAQEALANIQKHSRASHVALTLDVQPAEALLQIRDDGVGVAPNADQKPGHFGLRGMRERVEGLGGTFALSSSNGGGTVIEARVPVIP